MSQEARDALLALGTDAARPPIPPSEASRGSVAKIRRALDRLDDAERIGRGLQHELDRLRAFMMEECPRESNTGRAVVDDAIAEMRRLAA